MRNEYLAAGNRILRAKIKGRLQLSEGEKRSLAEIAHRLGRKAWAEVGGRKARYHSALVRKLVTRKLEEEALNIRRWFLGPEHPRTSTAA